MFTPRSCHKHYKEKTPLVLLQASDGLYMKLLTGITRLLTDDTSMTCAANNVAEIPAVINSDLEKRLNWAYECLVYFNPTETNFILYRYLEMLSLQFQNAALSLSDNRTHLGVILSSNGNIT